MYRLGSLEFVFLSSPNLISCHFSMIFAHFQTKRDFSVEVPTQGLGGGGGGGFVPPICLLKEALIRGVSTNYELYYVNDVNFAF